MLRKCKEVTIISIGQGGGGAGAGVGRFGKGRWQLLGAGSVIVLEWVGVTQVFI